MEDLHSYIVAKLDKISDEQAQTNIHLATLRTEVAALQSTVNEQRQELKPIKQHVFFMKNSARLVSLLGAASITVLGIFKYLHIV